MTPHDTLGAMTRPRPLYDRIASALLWLAAFCFATGVFFSLTLEFRALPPVKPVAVGVTTIEHYSKLRDYLAAALFMMLVAPLTIWFRKIGERWLLLQWWGAGAPAGARGRGARAPLNLRQTIAFTTPVSGRV